MLFKFGEAKRELVYGYYFAVFASQRREARRIRDISAAELIQLDCPCRVAASAELIAYFARFERKLGGYQIEERGLTYAGIARKSAYMAAQHGFHFIGSPAVPVIPYKN